MDETEALNKFISDLEYLQNFQTNHSVLVEKFKIAGISSSTLRSSRLLASFETCLQEIPLSSMLISNAINDINFDDNNGMVDYAVDLNSYVERLKNSFKITNPSYYDLEVSETLLTFIYQILEKFNFALKLYFRNS